MTTKRCIKCGTVEDYLDIDERCRHCKGALVKVRDKKSPDKMTKLAWKACDQCFMTGHYNCKRMTALKINAGVDTTCEVWQELTATKQDTQKCGPNSICDLH